MSETDLLTDMAYGDKRSVTKADRDAAHKLLQRIGRLERKAKAYDDLRRVLREITS